MFKVLNATKTQFLGVFKHPKTILRTFLSPAYYCNEIWDGRLNSPILQKVNLDIFYHELDQRFQKTRRISPVDVDVFANAIKDDAFIDELLDLVHKLRLSQDTGNTLDSTGHAVIRTLSKYDRVEDLLLTLDDRLNYGIFLDDYTANLLMDKFWKSKNFAAGAQIASQMMLQEDLNHPLTVSFSLLHCFNYLLAPTEWPKPPQPEEPEEDVKVRVKYLRNPFDDEHFDLKEPSKIVGKTLIMATKNKDDSLNKSLRIIGWTLFDKEEQAKKEFESCNVKLVKEIINLLPEDSSLKNEIKEENFISEDVNKILEKQVTESVAVTSEKDIARQCELFKQWENQRIEALEEQKKRVTSAERLAEVEALKQQLKEKEQRLWFFENEENIELAIEENTDVSPVKTEKKKIEEDYVPPEVTKRIN